MSLKALLAAGRLKLHKTGPNDLKKLFAVVDRDMKDARIAGLSADRRSTIAYNAVLQTDRALLAAEGGRTSSQRHHKDLLAEFWNLEKEAEKMLEGLAK